MFVFFLTSCRITRWKMKKKSSANIVIHWIQYGFSDILSNKIGWGNYDTTQLHEWYPFQNCFWTGLNVWTVRLDLLLNANMFSISSARYETTKSSLDKWRKWWKIISSTLSGNTIISLDIFSHSMANVCFHPLGIIHHCVRMPVSQRQLCKKKGEFE